MFYIEGTICKANEPDCENDLLTPSDIQTLYNHSKPLKFDINHNTQALDGILILDNYLNSVGDWCIRLISDNDNLNQQLDSGEITGFSLSSSLDTHVCSINQCVGECQYKDYNIGCWQPEYCSFVTHPCNRLGFNKVIDIDGGIPIDIISKLKDLINTYEEEEIKPETNKFSKGLVENHNPSPEVEAEPEVSTEEPVAEPEEAEVKEDVEVTEEVADTESESTEEEVAEPEAEEAEEEDEAAPETESEEDNDEVVEVEKADKKAAKEEEEATEDNDDIKKIVKALKNDDSFKEFIIGLVNDKPKADKSEDKEDNDKEEDNEESESKSAEDGEEDKPKTNKACKCAKSRTTKVSLGADVNKSEYNKYDLYKSTGRDATGRKI